MFVEDQPLSYFQPQGLFPKSDIRRMPSSELMRSAREIIIEHADTEYRLIRTGKDKLLLV